MKISDEKVVIPDESIIKLSVINAKNGMFFRVVKSPWNPSSLMLNDEPLQPSFKSGWFMCVEMKRFTRKTFLPNINYRFELIDPINFPNLPLTMPKSEVFEEKKDNDGYRQCTWKEEMKHLQGLYREVSDPQDPVIIEIPFEIESSMTIDRSIGENPFSYSVGKYAPITHENAKAMGIDELFYPNILHEHLPCQLTSKETYDIIREHVKRNIDPTSARVSSDYDFYFAVNKLVKLWKPQIKQNELLTVKGKSFKNKKYREYTITNREFSVFEMAHNYRGYKNIEPFSGDNHRDMQQKIDAYLEELMVAINTPLEDCPHCKGMGVIIEKMDER